MNDFTKEELEKILYIMDDWDSPMRHAYIATMHRVGEYKNVEIAQDLLATINDQQSEELKVIE